MTNTRARIHTDLAELLRSYSVFGLIGLVYDWCLTRLTVPNARLIRTPVTIRGKRYTRIGKGFTTGPGLRLDATPLVLPSGPIVTIGEGVYLNDYVHIAAVHSVTIGNRVLMASKVFISDHNHGTYSGDEEHSDPTVPPRMRALSVAPVIIQDDVWIGEAVAILPGVTIGKGAVLGYGAVVNRDIPAYSIAVGAPARVIKRYDFEARRWVAV